jgi:hypothetical protein
LPSNGFLGPDNWEGSEMAVEDVRVRLRRQLEDAFGVEEASILMDRPPGGWSDLVTNQTLDLKIDALRSDIRTEMSELRSELKLEMADLKLDMSQLKVDNANLSASIDRRLRAQTWMMMSTMIAGFGLTITLSRL